MQLSSRATGLPGWLIGTAPFALIALLVVGFIVFNPIGSLREPPPVEAASIERTVIREDGIELKVRNDGPGDITIAQVLVNDAYWNHTIGDRTLGRLEATELQIPYPWDEGLPLNIALVTSTGVTIEHEVEAATLTPEADASTFAIYGLLGLYIGLIPVVVGLLWYPSLRRVSPQWLGFFLALTVGLLAFLLVDTIEEGLELAGETGAALNGIGLFAIGALAAVTALSALEDFMKKKRTAAALSGLALAYLVAAGIGLHNLGEGLAVGAALAAGEIALGTFLVIGFAIHNTTEGLAIVAPLGRERSKPSLWHFAALGAVAGLPTVAGAWIGGFAFDPAWGTLAFGIAAGAIAQVVWTISRALPGEAKLGSVHGAAGFVVGLLIMFTTGLLTV